MLFIRYTYPTLALSTILISVALLRRVRLCVRTRKARRSLQRHPRGNFNRTRKLGDQHRRRPVFGCGKRHHGGLSACVRERTGLQQRSRNNCRRTTRSSGLHLKHPQRAGGI